VENDSQAVFQLSVSNNHEIEVLNKFMKKRKEKSSEEVKTNTLRISNLNLNERGLHTYHPVEDQNISSEDEEMTEQYDVQGLIEEEFDLTLRRSVSSVAPSPTLALV
jgi:superoxide dismutase